MPKQKITRIRKYLDEIPPFELSRWAIKVFVDNILTKKLTSIEKYKLARLFSDRLLDSPEYDQTS